MAVDALDIFAVAAIGTRRHASYETQRSELILRRLVLVGVRAFVPVAALVAQVMDIAHLELLDTVDFGLVVFDDGIHSLVTTVPVDQRRIGLHWFWSDDWGGGCDWWWLSSQRGPRVV